ncbi:MAG: hypothetical protein HY674_04095 [Chloroflexi bacterium]|nr:hypothetical protein [Chloroflexota bacterium]
MNIGSPESAAPASSENPDHWFTPGRFALILLGLVLVTFSDVILGSRTFVYRDFGLFAYPLAHYHRESFWSGEIPLWNPLNNCGVPFLAQWNTMTLYPLSLIYLLFPLAWSLAVFSLGHLVLAGTGMYFLSYRWFEHRFAACLAGLAFACNGLSLNCLLWPNNIAALGWMPWVVWLVERAWREGGRSVILAALAGGMQMLTGAPEIILFTWVLAVLLWVWAWRQEWPSRRQFFWRFLAVAMLVAGLAAAQLWPFLDLLAHSQRPRDASTSFWSMPGWGWANLIVPLFYSYPLSNDVFFQYDQLWTSSYYVSIGVLALAVLAVARRPEKRIGWLVLAALLGLVLALGENGFLYGWVRKAVPVLGFIRFPIKFVVLVVFALPLLAAGAMRRLADSSATTWKTEFHISLSLWSSLVALAGFLIWFAREYPQYEAPYDHWDATWRNGLVRLLFLSLIVGVALAVPKVSRSRAKWLLQLAMLLLIWIDVLTSAPRQPPTVARSVYEPGLKYISPPPAHGVSRAMMSREAFLKLYEPTSLDAYTNYLCNRLALNCNLNLLDNIPKVDGFYSLNLRETDDIRSFLYAKTAMDLPHLVDFLNVSHLTTPGKYLDWLKRDTFLPLITAGQKPIFADAITTLRGLTSSNFDARQFVYLPTEIRSVVTVTNLTVARILTPRAAAHRLEFEVDADDPGLVVIAQSFYHPWRAHVDGKAVPLWRANYAFQALEVGSGVKKVSLIYEDRNFLWGAMISGVALALCLFSLWRLARAEIAEVVLETEAGSLRP